MSGFQFRCAMAENKICSMCSNTVLWGDITAFGNILHEKDFERRDILFHGYFFSQWVVQVVDLYSTLTITCFFVVKQNKKSICHWFSRAEANSPVQFVAVPFEEVSFHFKENILDLFIAKKSLPSVSQSANWSCIVCVWGQSETTLTGVNYPYFKTWRQHYKCQHNYFIYDTFRIIGGFAHKPTLLSQSKASTVHRLPASHPNLLSWSVAVTENSLAHWKLQLNKCSITISTIL